MCLPYLKPFLYLLLCLGDENPCPVTFYLLSSSSSTVFHLGPDSSLTPISYQFLECPGFFQHMFCIWWSLHLEYFPTLSSLVPRLFYSPFVSPFTSWGGLLCCLSFPPQSRSVSYSYIILGPHSPLIH